ncbi:DUF2852 domain-containing protein [Acidisoma sp.]|uniref:DUF2852 domain-containing protein n=1 Tax=Acidisoma sp. TaxID=1872115 RepID=UPI003AFF93DD
MSGAANQGAYGQSGMGQPGIGRGPWGGRRSPGGPAFEDGERFGGSGPGQDYFGLWSISRPLLIAATITGFIVWWPVGLALLFVTIWNRKIGRYMFGRERAGQGFANFAGCGSWGGRRGGWGSRSSQSSGNRAFDEYRADTLRRLEEEQGEFAQFLDRLRFAKDKAEFDQFMAERRPRPSQPEPNRTPEG